MPDNEPARASDPTDDTPPNDAADGVSSGASDPPAPLLPTGRVGSPYWRLRGLVKTVRPHQWVKNVFVLAPVVFAKELFDPALMMRAGGAFAVFCLLAGAVYTMNDIADVEADRVHPVKRSRPIASGQVPIGLARALAVALVVVAMAGALYGPPAFAAVAAAYFLQNVLYSFWLKKIAYVDVALIALGFVLRVVAGGFATRIHVSAYLVVCTALLALFLGFGKRRHELSGEGRSVKKQRAALSAYRARTLTLMLALTGSAAVATYVLYTLDPSTRAMFHSDRLWLTTPFVVFGVVRFLQLVAGRPRAESPTQEMLRDVPFVVNLLLWVAVVLWLVYQLRPGATGALPLVPHILAWLSAAARLLPA